MQGDEFWNISKKIVLKDMSQPSSLNDLLNNYFFVCPESISQLNELASLV